MATRIVDCPECGQKNISKLPACKRCGASLQSRTSESDAADPKHKACPFCGEEILVVAIKCKHCQSNLPQPVLQKSIPAGQAFLLIAIGVGVIWALVSITGTHQREKAVVRETTVAPRVVVDPAKLKADRLAETQRLRRESAQRDAECKKDWKCWAEKNSLSASVKCQSQIEAKAVNDFEWIDGWLGSKFRSFRQSTTAGAFVYIGDQIKFQNQLGAWSRMTYACEYLPEQDLVLSVNLSDGRMSASN